MGFLKKNILVVCSFEFSDNYKWLHSFYERTLCSGNFSILGMNTLLGQASFFVS